MEGGSIKVSRFLSLTLFGSSSFESSPYIGSGVRKEFREVSLALLFPTLIFVLEYTLSRFLFFSFFLPLFLA